jgi:hypothetical protein
MFEEETINGVVYLVNKDTGEKIPKNTPTKQPEIATPLAVQNSEEVSQAVGDNVNETINLNNQLTGALKEEAAGKKAAGALAIDKLKNVNEIEFPQMKDKSVYKKADGEEISYQEAMPTFDAWKEKLGWKLPKRDDPKYKVEVEDFKYEQTDRQRLGGQLQILGAMFQELGNPQLYKGQTAAVGDQVLGRKEKGEKASLEEYQEAMAVAKANYEGDVEHASLLLEQYGIQVDDVKNQIEAVEKENQGIQQEFDNAITIFDTKVKQFTKTNEAVLSEYDLTIANLETQPAALREEITANVNIGNAIVEGMNFRDKMLEINQAEASLVMDLSKDFTAMNTVGDSRYGLSYEDKLANLLSSAGDSKIAQDFVNSFPKTRAEYDKNETTNLMDNAEQIIGVANALGIPEEFQEYILAEKILGVNVGSVDTVADTGLKYPQEQIDLFIGKSASAKKVYESASSIQQGLRNGTYSASGIDKFITDSKVLNAFASFSEAAGFNTDVQAKFEELKKETGNTQQAMASLIVSLIPEFTGEEGARKTTFDVTYTGEQIGSLIQQFEKGILTTTEGQINALDIIKDIAKESAQYNFEEAQNGKPTEPTDQLFADIDAKYSGGAEASVDSEDRANFKRLISNAGTVDSLRSMFSDPDMKAQVNNDIELKKDLMKQIRSSNPDLSISEAQALLDELLS